jgi:DNA-damage-inducible protein D
MKENLFETIKRLDNNGAEYWSSRELAKVLEYTDYRNFLTAVNKAKVACENSNEVIHNHFVDTNEMVLIGSGAEKPLETIYLSQDIHTKKKLKKSHKILDHMNSEELAANLFRATQTDAKIKRENIKGQGNANVAHYEVGQKVRTTIANLGGTMPEELPTPDAIGKVQTRIKKSKKIKKITDG